MRDHIASGSDDLPPELRETRVAPDHLVAIMDSSIQRNGSPPGSALPPGQTAALREAMTWRPPDWQVWWLRALRGRLADDAAQEWEF